MGNCTKTSKQIRKLSVKSRTFDSQSLVNLKFFVRLSKVKIRNLSFGSNKSQKIGVHFSVPFGSIKLAETEKNEEIFRWQSVHDLVYEASLSDINTHRLSILVESHGKLICSTEIKINSIIDGPVHQNMSLISNSLVVGRISFDLEFLEETQLMIEALSLRFELEEDNLGLFSSSIKFASDFYKESKHSEQSENPSWDFDEAAVNLSFRVTMNKIRDAALQLRLYKHHKTDFELVAECWISFTKIFAQDLSAIYRKESFLELRSVVTQQIDFEKVLRSIHAEHFKNINEEVWLCGRKVGKVEGAIKICGMPTFVQLISGVNTENGITMQNYNVLDTNKSRKNLPKEVMLIQKLMNKLKKSVKIKAGKAGAAHEREVFKYKKVLIDQLCDVLLRSAKDSIMLYTFESSKALIKSQKILIDLSSYLVEYAPMVNYDIKPYYFQAIILVISRGELDIGHLGIIKQENNNLEEKLEVAKSYYKLLYEVLKLSFSRMVFKGLDKSSQTYIDKTLAICWFRVPEFREKLIEILKKKSFYTIDEWKNNDIGYDEDTHEISNPLDWTTFHEMLPKDFRDDSFSAALMQQEWRSKLEKRGISFFSFFEEWIDHVYKQSVSQQFVWSCIPGYKILLKVFFIEMKERNTIEYPEALVSCACKLIYDTRTINVMVRILFSKTNVYDFHSVQEMFKVMNQLLTVYFAYKQVLPSNFDINFFAKGLKICLNDENALNIAKCLWFIYYQYHLLQRNLRKEIAFEVIIKSKYKKFFYHWSKDVRNMFHHLLCYRILSMEHLNFEKSGDNKEVDKAIQEKVEKNLSSLSAEDLRSLQAPYFEIAQNEFLKIKQEYEDWVKNLPTKGNKLFSVSETFPYPLINPKLNFIDLSERRLEEQW